MANFSAKCSIMTQEMVDSFCESFYIPAEVHPTAPGCDKTIAQFPAGKVGVYTRIFDVCGYRIPFTKFFMAVLKYFRVHISQLSPFGAARVSHFEVLTRVLDLSPSVTVFRAFYTRTFSDGLFSFAKRSTSAPSCFPKPPDSIKNWADHFFWVDSCVFPISVPLYMGGVLEKDPAPHLTARQEQTVKLLESHKAPFRRYPECFLCLVGLSPYYPFDDNSYPAFERPDGTDMGLLDFIKTADPRKVRAVEVQKGDDQERVTEKDAYLELADPGEGTATVRQSDEEVVTEQSKKIKKKRLTKQSDVLPAKRLRTDHPSLASGTGGKTLAGLEQIMPAGSRLLGREQSATPSVAPPQESESFVDLSAQASLQIRTTVGSSSTLSAPVDTAAATTTSTKAKLAADVNPDLAGPSQLEESEGSDDSFYELATLDPSEAKRWYVPRWNITNDSLLDDGFSCRTLVDRVAPPAFFSALRSMDCDQLYTEFNVGAAQQIFLGSKVRSRAEHELELKEKLNAKYAARGKLLEKKDSEILRLKSQLAEKEAKTAEVVRLRDQVSSLSGEKSAFTAEVSALKVTITQKDHDISLLDSRATHLESTLNDAQAACTEAGTKLRNYTRDGSVDFGMQEGLEAGYEHGVAGRSLSVVDAYNPEVASADYVNAYQEFWVTPWAGLWTLAARASYVDAVKALEDASFPLVDLLKSKKDVEMDEVLDCFLLDGPLAGLPEAAYLQPCIEQILFGKPVDHMEKTASLRSCSDEIFGGANHGSQHGVINRGGNSFASVLQAKSNKKVVKIQELRNENVVEGAAVVQIPFEASWWRLRSTVHTNFLHDDFFLFQFENKDGMDKVLEDGPWLIRTVPLILNVWSPNTDLKKAEVKKAPVWIKLHHVPIVAYSEIGLSLITTQLGKPIMLDSYTSSMCLSSWGKSTYARALIEVSADNELLDSLVIAIPIDKDNGHTLATIDVEYEWNPPRCATCKIFDHHSEICPKLVKDQPVVNDADEVFYASRLSVLHCAFDFIECWRKVSSLRAGFKDFKEKMEVQQEEQAQELYNRVAELEAHVMDGILGHALGRAVDFGMQEGLEVGHEHGVAGRSLSVVDAYNPKVASADYGNAVKALEDAHFPLVDLLKSKKDARMDEVLDCFLLDGPLAELPEAASLQPCIEQLSIPIHHAGDKTAVGETSISFALMNVHARAEGAKKHVTALPQLMMEIVSTPLSSQTWVGEASISATPLSIEDYAEEDTYEALGSVVSVPNLERCCL
ncbi:gypsy type transposase [Tanacetum coccineum]